jgi:uncharacterized repeat protein (TIGR02543 family)
MRRTIGFVAAWLMLYGMTPERAIGYTLIIAANPEGAGTTAPAAGVHPGYPSGTVVQVHAMPAPGYAFLQWNSSVGMKKPANCSDNEIVMNSNVQLTAKFITAYKLTTKAQPVYGGTTAPAGTQQYLEGTVVDITAYPALGWRFLMWEDDQGQGQIDNPYNASTTNAMIRDRTIRANFKKQWSITLNVNPPAAGIWSGDGGDIPEGTTRTYDQGQYLNYSARPASGYLFVRWSGDISSRNVPDDPFAPSHTFQADIDRDLTITANFAPARTLTIGDNPVGSGNVFPRLTPYQWPQGFPLDLWAEPKPGYQFLNWTGDVADVADPNRTHITIVMDRDKTVTANFWQASILTMAVNRDLAGVTVPAIGSHPGILSGTAVAIKAISRQGYRFDHWSGPVVNPNNANTFIVVRGSVTVTAQFNRL